MRTIKNHVSYRALTLASRWYTLHAISISLTYGTGRGRPHSTPLLMSHHRKRLLFPSSHPKTSQQINYGCLPLCYTSAKIQKRHQSPYVSTATYRSLLYQLSLWFQYLWNSHAKVRTSCCIEKRISHNVYLRMQVQFIVPCFRRPSIIKEPSTNPLECNY